VVVSESDPGPARFILYSNLPITCQAKIYNPVKHYYEYLFCWIKFAIRSSADIAMRQRLPYGLQSNKTACTYEIKEEDWKPDEGYAYDSDRSLDVVAKVQSCSDIVRIPTV